MSTQGYQLIDGWTVDRGRNYELDKTGTGTASYSLVDTHGRLDPTNSSSPFNGKLNPMKQTGVSLKHPITGVFHPLFRGYVTGYSYDLDVTQKLFRGKVDCVDMLDLLARYEVVPVPGSVGTTPPGGAEGDAYYASQSVQDRIKAAIADGNISASLTDIFTGNVNLQAMGYPPRTTLLSVIQDAADGEFPGVANFFCSKTGILTFHGRKARFNPTLSQYGINHWYAGDTSAVNSAPSTTASIAALSFARDAEHLYNAVLSTPQNIKNADIAGQLVTDTTSIGTYGPRSESFENLITLEGQNDGNDANAETKLFATYYVDNYKDPQNRISQVKFSPVATTASNASAHWNLLCGVELGDLITVTTTHPGGGGFAGVDFFIEGIHYEADYQLPPPLTNVTLTLDLSPRAYYTTDPFS